MSGKQCHCGWSVGIIIDSQRESDFCMNYMDVALKIPHVLRVKTGV